MNFGLWEPYIERDILNLYPLYYRLERSIARYHADGNELEPLSKAAFASLRHATISYADRSVKKLGLPYHNLQHFLQVEENGRLITQELRRQGWEIPAAVEQAQSLANLLHDCHHCGATFRHEAREQQALFMPRLPVNVSVEWVSAAAANDFMQQQKLIVPWRVFATSVIFASTVGGDSPLGKQFRIPTPQPIGIFGCGMQAADVCPLADFEQWTKSAVGLLYSEKSAFQPALTVASFASAQQHFLQQIVSQSFDALDTAAGKVVTARLGWRRRIETHSQALQRLVSGDERLVALVQQEALRFGVVLG